MKFQAVKVRLIITLFVLIFLITIPLSSGILAKSSGRELFSYTVQNGDTLSKISKRFGVTQAQIVTVNNIQNRNLIWAGQTLYLPESDSESSAPASNQIQHDTPKVNAPSSAALKQHVVRAGESLSSIAQLHGVSLQALRDSNPTAGLILYVGDILNIPDYEQGQYANLGEIFWPVEGRWVVKGYQYGHRAIDIVVPTGSPIQSLGDGTVEYAGWSAVGYGNMILIDHGGDLHTLYAHLSEIQVQTGDAVGRNETIGLSGSTGNSSMPHLHLEIRDGFSLINPCLYLDGGC